MWWASGPLRRLHDRIGLCETAEPVALATPASRARRTLVQGCREPYADVRLPTDHGNGHHDHRPGHRSDHVGPSTGSAHAGWTDQQQGTSDQQRHQQEHKHCGGVCTPSAASCDLYLRRVVTHRYAQLLAVHPYLAAGATQVLAGVACKRAFTAALAAISCEAVASTYVGQVESSLQEASRRHQCLRLTITAIPPILRAAVDNSLLYCTD